MGSNPFSSADDGTHTAADLQFLPDVDDEAVSWQAGLDEIDAFFASCRTTPRRSADAGDQGSKEGDKGGAEAITNGVGERPNASLSLSGPVLNTASRERHHADTPEIQTEASHPAARSSSSPQQQKLVKQPGDSSSKSPANRPADVAPDLSTLHVKASSPVRLTTHLPSADKVKPEHQTSRTDAIEPPGSPMDIDTPSSPRNLPSTNMVTPQPATSVSACDAPDSSTGKSSLFEEMRGEDSDAVNARYTPESNRARSPPFGCEVARRLNGAGDLLHDLSNPDLPTSLDSDDSPPVAVQARQSRERVAVNDCVARHEGAGTKHARSPSSASTCTVHDTDMAIDSVENATESAAPSSWNGEETVAASAARDSPTAPTSSAESEHDEATESFSPQPPLKKQKQKKRETKSTGALGRELRALRASTATTPRTVSLGDGDGGGNRTTKRSGKTPATSSRARKVRQMSPRRTRAQQSAAAAAAAPSGAAAAKSRHRQKG
nr:hypothetical protein CFP56_50787 [Quercus suber]